MKKQTLHSILCVSAILFAMVLWITACAPAPSPTPVAPTSPPAPVVPTSPLAPVAPTSPPATGTATSAPQATPAPTLTKQPVRQGGDLRIIWAVDMALFDPPQESRGLGRAAINHVFQGLTKLNTQTGLPEPDLATSWKVSTDQLTWTFNLRQDVQFQDGAPFNADAVVANAKRWIDPKVPHASRSRVAPIKDIRAVDPFTVEFQLSTPVPLLAAIMGHGNQHMISPLAIQKYGVELGQHLPAGTGPFKLVEFIPRQKIVMERWNGYRGTQQVYLNRIIWETVSDDNTRTARLLTGEADMNLYQSLQDTSRVGSAPGLELLHGASMRQWLLYINANQPHLADVRVRQALNYAIDQKALVKVAFLGFASPGTSLIGAGHSGAIQVNPIYEYDRDKAIALMKEAGWTRGADGKLRDKSGNVFKLRMDITTAGVYPQDDALADAVSGMYEAIGIELNVVHSDRTTFFAITASDKDAPKRNELAGLPVSVAEQDGAVYLNLVYGKPSLSPNCCNWASYSNPAGWAAIDAAVAEADPAKRLTLIGQAQQILWKDVPAVLLPQTEYVIGKSKRVQGIILSPGELHQFSFSWFEAAP